MESSAELANLIIVWGNAVLTIIGAASVLASLTPTPKDDRILAKTGRLVSQIVNLVGFNFGHAKNRE